MDEPLYVAFELPSGTDPDAWCRALLAQVEREVRYGARKPGYHPKVYLSSGSVRGTSLPEAIAERDAYPAVVKFDVRHFEAADVGRRELPVDAVEVREPDRRTGRVFCFPDGLWRVTLESAAVLVFTSVNTGQRVSVRPRDDVNAAVLDRMYADRAFEYFRSAGDARPN